MNITMDNEYISYYKNQIGSGITGFSGSRYQTGNSWKSFFKILKPALQFIAKIGMKTAANIGSDLLEGESLDTSVINRLKESGKVVGKEAVNKLNSLSEQIGKGLRKRKYTKRNKEFWSSKKRKICKIKKKSINRARKRNTKLKISIKRRKTLKTKKCIKKKNKILCPY